MAERKSRTITKPADIEYIANITESDITTSFIMDIFGEFESGQKFRPYDIITIPANCYGPEGKKNKKPFTTTVGLYVFNKYFIEQELFDILKYINEPITSKMYSKINSISCVNWSRRVYTNMFTV